MQCWSSYILIGTFSVVHVCCYVTTYLNFSQHLVSFLGTFRNYYWGGEGLWRHPTFAILWSVNWDLANLPYRGPRFCQFLPKHIMLMKIKSDDFLIGSLPCAPLSCNTPFLFTHGGKCWVTWWGVLSYMVESVGLYCKECWLIW